MKAWQVDLSEGISRDGMHATLSSWEQVSSIMIAGASTGVDAALTIRPLLLYTFARLQVALSEMETCIPSGPDGLSASQIPSVVAGNSADRVIAEIDQQGVMFAVDERDRSLFAGAPAEKQPRIYHEIEIVLRSGDVLLRKKPLARRPVGLRDRLLQCLKFTFYVEAAALLRLRGVPGIPVVRRIDTESAVIEMDYIWGRDLRERVGGPEANSMRLQEITTAMAARGVIARDLHGGNLVRAYGSGVVYLVDFNLVWLIPAPRWRRGC